MIYKTITVKQRAHEQNENVCESPTYFQQNINDPQFVSRKVAIITPRGKRIFLHVGKLGGSQMSYLSSIFSYCMLALLLMLDDLFPLPLLQCADLLDLQLSLGAVIVSLLALHGYKMRCFAVVDGFSILLNWGAQNLELCSSPYSCT